MDKLHVYKKYFETADNRAPLVIHRGYALALVKMVEKQQQEYITLSQSIEEDDAMIQQLQDEVKLLKLHESILLERVKKAESKSRFHKYMELEQQNLAYAQEIAWFKEMLKGEQPV